MKQCDQIELDLSINHHLDEESKERGVHWLALDLLSRLKDSINDGNESFRDRHTYESPESFLKRRCTFWVTITTMILFWIVMIAAGAFFIHFSFNEVRAHFSNMNKILLLCTYGWILNILFWIIYYLLRKLDAVSDRIENRIRSKLKIFEYDRALSRRTFGMWLMLPAELFSMLAITMFDMKKAKKLNVIKLRQDDEDLRKIEAFLGEQLGKEIQITVDSHSNEFSNLTVWTAVK